MTAKDRKRTTRGFIRVVRREIEKRCDELERWYSDLECNVRTLHARAEQLASDVGKLRSEAKARARVNPPETLPTPSADSVAAALLGNVAFRDIMSTLTDASVTESLQARGATDDASALVRIMLRNRLKRTDLKPTGRENGLAKALKAGAITPAEAKKYRREWGLPERASDS